MKPSGNSSQGSKSTARLGLTVGAVLFIGGVVAYFMTRSSNPNVVSNADLVTYYEPGAYVRDVENLRMKHHLDEEVAVEDINRYYDVHEKERFAKMHEAPHDRHINTFRVLQRLGIKEGMRVLEMGCGNGVTTNFIYNTLTKNVDGVDLNPNHINDAIAHAAGPGMNFHVGDMRTLNLGKQFDVITMVDSFEHIQEHDWDQVMNVLNRHSHVGTLVYISIPAPEYQISMYETHAYKRQAVDEIVTFGPLITTMWSHNFAIRHLNYWHAARADLVFVYEE
mmetsp:Transcript_15338/g.43503  ORF Transcript_15338/g.43503 Transcript_15338/m.43503 type:complete len:279 (+) Transcript_15338:80-916(+)